MRIACPSCAAEYDVPEAALAAGPRLMRCTRCGHRFEAAAPAPAPKPTPDPAPDPAPDPGAPRRGASALQPESAPPAETPAPPPPPASAPAPERPLDPPAQPPRGALILAWLLSLAVLAGLGWAFWRHRDAIIESFPPAARLYDLFGP